jgi:hypothetical protein
MLIQFPIHQHDCDGCRFLGSFDNKDVWSCDDIDLIIRHGSREEDNKALPITVVMGLTAHEDAADWHRALSLYNWRQFPVYWRDIKYERSRVAARA